MANIQEVIRVTTDTGSFTLKGRMCELSSFSFIPTERHDPPERTVFNSVGKNQFTSTTYDRVFTRKNDGYNNKLHRCDREHAKSRGLAVNDEEKLKDVPTLASSVYGHRWDKSCDKSDREHVRIGLVKAEFYRRNGIPLTL